MRRAFPLSIRTLALSFACMCGILTAGFFALHVAIKARIEDGLKESLERTEQQVDLANARYDRRNTAFLAILSNDTGLKAAVGLVREQDTPSLRPDVERTIEDQLREISKGLDYDLLVVLGSRGNPVAAIGSGLDRAHLPPLRGLRPGVPALLPIRQTVYRVTSVPINMGAENLGMLVVGEKFDLHFPGWLGYSVLEGPEGIVASTLPGNLTDQVSRQLLAASDRPLKDNQEIRAGGEDFLAFGRARAGVGAQYRLYDLASVSDAMDRFAQGLWQAFAITGLGSILMALLLSAFVSRSISKPLAGLAAHLEGSGESGDLPQEYDIESSTLEVNVLARALNRASMARRQFEADLIKAKDAAEAGSRAKSEFLANISHELRTPLNGILGPADLTLDTDLTTEQREYLGLIKLSGNALLGIISDILDFSKIGHGQLDLNFSAFSLRDWLDEIIEVHRARAQEKGLDIASELQAGAPSVVVSDPLRLRQIMMHLVGNAIKFTERGRVKVYVGSQPAGEGECQLHCCVEDTGIGIPQGKQTAIFEAFSQADGSATRSHGGTGLGLTIASELVELMQGRMWLESEEGKGSRFHFALRCGVPEYCETELRT
ncbi:MAG TPA: ATP-binding protein [Terriglobia bacterium]|nr:ATP-binding protein [Terriglobia bacterium]